MWGNSAGKMGGGVNFSDVNKDSRLKAKDRTEDCRFALKDNQVSRTKV